MIRMGFNRVVAAMLGLAGVATIVGCPAIAVAADGIKAAYVETVIPSKTYAWKLNVNGITPDATAAPAIPGVLGITSIILTNYSATTKLVEFGTPAFYGGASCGSSGSFGANVPSMNFYVPPQSTLSIPFPAPYVINPAGGQACFFASGGFLSLGDQVDVFVVGVIN